MSVDLITIIEKVKGCEKTKDAIINRLVDLSGARISVAVSSVRKRKMFRVINELTAHGKEINEIIDVLESRFLIKRRWAYEIYHRWKITR
jgi:hypothetical protein